MEQKIIYEGWDAYKHNYKYDEVKVISILYNRLVEKRIQYDWEKVMQVGHNIWLIYESQFYDADGSKSLKHKWMKVQSQKEAAYVQAYLARTIDDFIKFYKNGFILF